MVELTKLNSICINRLRKLLFWRANTKDIRLFIFEIVKYKVLSYARPLSVMETKPWKGFWKSKVEALFLESKLTTVLRPAYLDYKWLWVLV
jgi:hypothetical protein